MPVAGHPIKTAKNKTEGQDVTTKDSVEKDNAEKEDGVSDSQIRGLFQVRKTSQRGKMKVVSQSKNRQVEIPDDTPMLLAEESKRVRSFRNARNVRSLDGEMFMEGDLWRIEKVIKS